MSSTSSGAPIQISSGRVNSMPMPISTTPEMRLMVTAVCTLSRVPCSSPLPSVCPTVTLVPMDSPMKRLTSRLVSELVEPTAARDSLPAKRPTTITSAALNRSCRQPESINGKLKATIPGSTGPLHISIRYDLPDIFVPPFSYDLKICTCVFQKRYLLI